MTQGRSHPQSCQANVSHISGGACNTDTPIINLNPISMLSLLMKA
jgi:hypothetical protein